MNKDLQDIKINQKLNVLSQLIESLSNYNNIEGYTNQKKFTIHINYRREINNPNYYYTVNITRGTNKPKTIFNMRFVSYKKIDKELDSLIKELINNTSFTHTSFSSSYNCYTSYNINLKNNVEVKFGIKTQEDLESFKEIEKQFNKKEIIIKPAEATKKTKDELQEEKMISTIDLMGNLLNILEEYNNIEDYDNKKPFRLSIKNYYDKFKECYVFAFIILRGNTKPEIFLSLNASIKTKDLFYSKIYNLIMNYKQKENFLIDMISNNNFKENYSILTKSNISLEFVCEDDLDKNFYLNLSRETSEKRPEFDLSPTKNKLLNPEV